jgi:hypothetical protein
MKIMRDRKLQQRITIFLGIFLSFGMIASVILPLLSQNLQQSAPAERPTETPAPTAPAPPDTSTISFDEIHLHSSGLFTVAVPTGWTVSNEFSTDAEAQLTMQNPRALSVLEVRVLAPAEDVELDSVNNLGAQFTEDWLRSSWRQYNSWREDTREVVNDELIIDFNLSRSGQNYVARQIASTDGTWIYVVRVVMPSNASEAMRYVLENEDASLKPIERYLGEALAWNGYFDNSASHLIRFPSTWAVTDSADGVPASIAGEDVQMRVETATGIDSSDAASAYVAALHTGTEVQSVEAVEQYGLSGYRVSYTVPTLDGPTESGIALILNDESGVAHVANALLTDVQNSDLNSVDLAAEDTAQSIKDVREALDTFSLLPELQLSSNG